MKQKMVTFAPGTREGGRHAQFAGVLPEKPETQYSRNGNFLHRGQGREAGMHSLLLRHSLAEYGNFLHPEEGREAGVECLLLFYQRKLRHSNRK